MAYSTETHQTLGNSITTYTTYTVWGVNPVTMRVEGSVGGLIPPTLECM